MISIGLFAHASILRVGPEADSYNDIHSAVAASTANDTLIISAHSEPYSLGNEDLVIQHPLHIYGAGWPRQGSLGTRINMNGRHIFLPPTASGTSFKGFAIEGAPACGYGCPDTAQTAFVLESGTSSILFERVLHQCTGDQYQYWSDPSYGTFIWAQGDNSGIRLQQCALYFGLSIGSSRGTALRFSGGNSSLVVQNCLMANVGTPCSFSGTIDLSFHQNVVWTCTGLYFGAQTAGSATNNVFVNTPAVPYGVDCAFNAGTGSAIGSNWIALSGSPFINLPDGSMWLYDQFDVHLAPGSPCIDAGVPNQTDRDGSRVDAGIYGGQFPFVDSGNPDFPFVTSLAIPATIPQNGVLPIYSTGRVGSGQ
jgi:hypothetical protein